MGQKHMKMGKKQKYTGGEMMQNGPNIYSGQ